LKMSAEQEVMSKSARQRAAKKARDAAAAAEAAPPAPAAPAAKGKAKAKAEPKAEAKAKATPKKEEPAPKATGKAKAAPKEAAAGKAKAAPKGAAAPVAEAPKAEAKSKAKAKAKKAKEEAPPAPKEPEIADGTYLDDGTGGDWEEASGLNKKQEAAQRRKAAKEEAAKAEAAGAEKAAKDAEIAAAKAAKAASKKGLTNAEVLAKMDQDMEAGRVARAKAKEAGIAVASAKGEGKGAPEKEPEVDDGSISVTIPIPQGKIGRIIGPKGANITFIKEKTGVKAIDTQGDVAVIIGQPEDVPKAEMAIRELIEKGYMSISYENFKADQITVPSTAIPNIIGKGGAIIQVIKKECEVEVDVEATPKQAEGAKRVVTKVKVSIVGELANVEKAKECIQSIAEFSHHEITHPGYTHEELAIEEWKYRFIIGPGGSQMRHIQNSWHVQVNIPRDGGEDAKVLVVGEAISVEKAVKYINKVVEEAEQPTGRDKPEKTQDKWDKDDEGPEEAWMSGYMYKRR